MYRPRPKSSPRGQIDVPHCIGYNTVPTFITPERWKERTLENAQQTGDKESAPVPFGSVAMSIQPFLKGAVFTPVDIHTMSAALNDVCKSLQLRNDDVRGREVIATRIIELTRRGEHNPARLRDRVLSEANGATL